MSRRFLVVCTPSSISKTGERIVIRNGFRTQSVPVRYIDALLIMTKVSISSEAVQVLLRRNVPLFFGTLWGKVRGSLISHEHMSKVNNRLTQYEALKTKQLEIAKHIVVGKILSVEENFSIDLKTELMQAKKAKNIGELMGIEGTASRKMFEVFSKNIKDCGLEFEGRSYRPPRDPVNALLSLSYTFAHSLAYPVVVFLGYDPYISFLHSKRGSHASFCSDILEFVRPTLTKELETALLSKTFKEEDFNNSAGGYYLKREKLGKFLSWFESIKEQVIQETKEALLQLGEVMK